MQETLCSSSGSAATCLFRSRTTRPADTCQTMYAAGPELLHNIHKKSKDRQRSNHTVDTPDASDTSAHF
eukprot:1160275-Pelagomonas_calceolata.AAC.5